MYNSYSENISNFMRWASRRIAEEVAANEKLEEEAGSSDCFVRHSHLPHNLTNDEKLEYVLLVDRLRNEKGMLSKQACARIGIHQSTYSQWRKKFGMGKFKKQIK